MSTIFGSPAYNLNQTIDPVGAGNVIDRSRNTKWDVTGGLTMNLGTVTNTASSVSFNTLFLACENVGGYNLALGTGGTSIASSTEAPKTIDGQSAAAGDRQYVTHTFTTQTDSSVILTITAMPGQTASIYRCYIFNSVWSYIPVSNTDDSLQQLSQGQELRGSVTYNALDGTISKTPPLNGNKFLASYQLLLTGDTRFNKRIDDLAQFLEENPIFTHAPSTDAYPARVYQAILSTEITLAPIGRNTSIGEHISFSVLER